jgi:hypothetical protein
MQIVGVDKDIEISLPRSLAIQIPKTLEIQPESLTLTYQKALDFPYEWLWGGPIHKDKGLYLFELGFTYKPGKKLLSEDVQSRIQRFENYYKDWDEGSWKSYVLKHLNVEEYQSQQGYLWVMKNLPTVKPHHEVFYLPISEDRELIVLFWYNEDWAKDNPEWYERRKALSRRILDTVKLSEP